MKSLLLAGLLTLTPALAGGAGAPPDDTLRMTAPDGTAFTMRVRNTVTVRASGDTQSPLAQGFASASPFSSDTLIRYGVRRTPAGAEVVGRSMLPLPDGREAELRSVEVFGPGGQLRELRTESDAPELAPFVAATAQSGSQVGNSPYGMPLRAGATRTVHSELDMSTLFNSLMGGLGVGQALRGEATVRTETTVTALGPQSGGFAFRMVTRSEGFNLDVTLPGGGDMSVRGEPFETVATVVYDAQGLPLRGDSRTLQTLTVTVRLPEGAPTTVRFQQETVSSSGRQ